VKSARQAEILSIIRARDIETQEQLLAELESRGFSATQATISRDIKALRLVKQLTGNGGYRYAQSEQKEKPDLDVRLRSIFKQSVLSFDVAQNIVVVRTMPGLASAACSALDGMKIEGLVGTLAGDDTGILIMRDSATAMRFESEVHQLLK